MEKQIINKKILDNREILKTKLESEDIKESFLTKNDQLIIEKPYEKEGNITILPDPFSAKIYKSNIIDCIKDRRSRRNFSEKPINLNQLSLLLYTTYGIKKKYYDHSEQTPFRTVPSRRGILPFESYLIINNVKDISNGIYRYLPTKHSLLFLHKIEKFDFNELGLKDWVTKSSVIFAWSAIPYRAEYSYGIDASKWILQEVGHICQNLYLMSEAIHVGVSVINFYDQDNMDKFLNLDGNNEFTIYLAAIGNID